MGHGWKYYNHAMIPNCAPHESVDLEPIHNGTIWKEGHMPLLVRWTTNYDCDFETQWWYTVLDHPFSLEKIKAKHRYQIKQGIKNFRIQKIDFEKNRERILEILNTVKVKNYTQNETKSISKPTNGMIYIGAFDNDSNELVGYAVITEHETYVDFTTLKVLSEYEKKSINAAIIYHIVDMYNEKLGDIYISNGERTINHKTTFNDYLIRLFEFRKVYCKLHIKYRWWFGIIVKCLFPFRSIIKTKAETNQICQQVYGVLQMEEYSTKLRKR